MLMDSSLIQWILTALLVLAALVFAGRRLWLRFKRKGGCGCRCSDGSGACKSDSNACAGCDADCPLRKG